MAIESIELVYRLMFFIGLGLAALGAYWLYRYAARPKSKDYEKWKSKNKKKHDEAKLTDKKAVLWILE